MSQFLKNQMATILTYIHKRINYRNRFLQSDQRSPRCSHFLSKIENTTRGQNVIDMVGCS